MDRGWGFKRVNFMVYELSQQFFNSLESINLGNKTQIGHNGTLLIIVYHI